MKAYTRFLLAITLFSGLSLALADTTTLQAPVLPSLAPILNKAKPAIVNLRAIRGIANQGPATLGGRPDGALSTSQASGVIVDAENGYILTNQHVIQSAEEIVVTLSDGRHFFAKIVGSDPLSDVAVLKIDATKLTAIPFGYSEKTAVGDFVVAIGNPFGLSQTVTSGIISALGRTDLGIEGYEDFIQTDASINPGNSGGALINLRGELIGINTAIIAPDGGNIGIGFAIPINMARDLMSQLIQFGAVKRGLLGVIAQPLTPDLANAFDLSEQQGALVAHVDNHSIADQAGVRVGDIVQKIDNKNITSANGLRNAIGLIPIGKNFNLTLIREGKTVHLSAKMADPQQSTTPLAKLNQRLMGLELGKFEEDLPTHGHVQGLQILSMLPNSPAYRQGLRVKDIIVSANGKAITNLDNLEQVAKAKNKNLLLRVLRNATAFFTILSA